MDNTNVPVIDLNIDPNMIAAQDTPPQQATPPAVPVATPVEKTPGVIDITPGSTDIFPTDTPVSNHVDTVPLSEPKTIDITPTLATTESLSQPSTLAPEPAPPSLPPMVPPSVPVASNPVPEESIPQAPAPVVSPLAEDPDLVKLVK